MTEQQKRIEQLEGSIRTARDLISFFEDREEQLGVEATNLIARLKQEVHIHRAWLVSARSATGW